ncbi:MAG TPA: N-acetylmuramoyl-L-alanine amidase, partial [Polyangiaceae bacterium]|nr:N-acetylmuramoyl-L-alanine amidase [Polyangiaceae bacterium]
MQRSPLVLALLVGMAACGSEHGPSEAAPPPSDAERAAALVAVGAPLPTRAEIVALADAVAIDAEKEASLDEQAKLFALAGRLRARIFRFEATEADAREALELFSRAARSGRGKEAGCDAELARATLSGELARSAATTYRELYLAKRRLGPLREASPDSACLASLGRALARGAAFSPTGDELAALEREGDRAEASAPAPPPLGSDSATAPAACASAAPSPSDDVVILPTDLKPASSPVKVTKIDKYAEATGGRVVIQLSGATTFQVGSLAPDGGKDARIYLDIDRASVKGIARELEVGGAIKRIRTAPRDGGGSRIVLDLSSEMHRRVFYLPEPFRIVVDVSSRKPATGNVSASGARTVKRVVIDPGHGGEDAGAVGPTGLKEKDVTLDIAHRVAPLLAHELGVETLVTRDSDVFVPLDERAARANAFHADLFVSIHCNASDNGEARGIEVFVLDELKDTSRAAARVAALENGLLGPKALDPAALDAQMAGIVSRLRTGETAASSRKLGELLSRATLASLSEKYPSTADHGLKSAGFYVLAGAEMPAVLFETSFISNPDDE